MGFEVERIDNVLVAGPQDLTVQNLMSPFVWRASDQDAGLMALIRAEPRHRSAGEESGRIWFGRSASDGLLFQMDMPVLLPSPEETDSTGCEDPTVIQTDEGYVVLYTGVDDGRTGHLLYATGADMCSLEKRGVALANGKNENNTKEGTVLRSGDRWRLFYEYAHDGHSLISLTEGSGPPGPWHEQPDPFGPRPAHWDSWHLSTGPLLLDEPDRPVMFYNGANRNADWGIGWVVLSADLRSVVSRSSDPLISPPRDATGPRDIAFASSLVETEGTIWLYYSRNDRELKRATIRRTG